MSEPRNGQPRYLALAGFSLAIVVVLGYGGYRLVRHHRADQHLQAARQALAQRDFPSARADLAACLAIWPDDAAAHVLAARAARRAGDLGEAERQLDLCQSLSGLPPELELERALLRAQRGDLAAVETLLLNAVQHESPDAPLIYEVLVPAYIAAFRLPQAFDMLEHWERIEPAY